MNKDKMTVEQLECIMQERYKKFYGKYYGEGVHLYDVLTNNDGTIPDKKDRKRICTMRTLALKYDNVTVTCNKIGRLYDFQMIFWFKTKEEKHKQMPNFYPYLAVACRKDENNALRKQYLNCEKTKPETHSYSSGGSCPIGGCD